MESGKHKLLQRCGWLGVAGVALYFFHIIIGNILYESYNPVTQTISDLTADGAQSQTAATVFSVLYGVFTTFFALAFYILFRKKINRIFSLGALLFFVMNFVSVVGYAFFPLSEVGGGKAFQDTMHIIITGVVVALSIASFILLAIGFIKTKKYKAMGILAIITLALMMVGSITSGAVASILGLAERVIIYSLQLYILTLSIWMLKYKE